MSARTPITILNEDGTATLDWNGADDPTLCTRELVEQWVATHNECVALRARVVLAEEDADRLAAELMAVASAPTIDDIRWHPIDAALTSHVAVVASRTKEPQ